MDFIHLAIDPRDPVWIAIAFLCGFAVRLIGLPPLIGFLLAGFLLNALGAEGGEFLGAMADLGITLLLFTIGLKLRVQSLVRPEVWAVASIHMITMTLLFGGLVLVLSAAGFSMFAGLDMETSIMIGFALSFSSTVFAIKILDELGATMARNGQISIGVLIVQDIAAVVFIAISSGKIPSLWALGLLLLIPLRHLLHRVLDRTGHGELLVLFGIVLALGGADIFELFDIKGDVGALIIGMLLAGHHRANEMAKALMSFKDLFLVGFFLSVGMTALPGFGEIVAALVFLLFLPLKVAIYFGLFGLFRLRASTCWRTSLNLANYSEFGLIVGAVATTAGWLPATWLATFAIVVSASFIISAPLVTVRDRLYNRWRPIFKKYERKERLSGEEDLDIGHINIVVFGMGRIGLAVYRAFVEEYGDRLLGVELDEEKCRHHRKLDRNVVTGDATNPDFWARTPGLVQDLQWVMLALPSHAANIAAVNRLKEMGYTGKIAAASRHDDDAEQLRELGVELSYNLYAEAGRGFADDLRRRFQA